MKINKLRLKDKNKYLIVEPSLFNNETLLLDFVASELENGTQIIQLNTNNSYTKNLINIGKRIRELCSIYNALFIVSDRIDITNITEADGIFLDENSYDIYTAREQLGNDIIIGTNFLTDEADYIISDDVCNQNKIPCFVKIKSLENNNKKIIYKKFKENT